MGTDTSSIISAVEREGRFRFSLRSLIGTMTAVAMFIGLITHYFLLWATLFSILYLATTVAFIGLLFWLSLPIALRRWRWNAFNKSRGAQSKIDR